MSRRWLLLSLFLVVLVGLGSLLVPRWRAMQAYHSARGLAERRDFVGAISKFDTIHRVWSEDPEVALFTARTYRRAGRLAEVEPWLQRCRELPLSSEDIRLESNLLAAQRGEMTRVESYLLPWLQPQRAEFVLVAEVLTQEWMRQNRLSNALQVLNKWIERAPEAEAFVRRAWVQEHLLQAEPAIIDYRRALELDPSRDPVRLRIAELLIKETKPEEARPYLNELLQRLPDDPAVLLASAQCHRLSGAFDEATLILDRLLRDGNAPAEVLSERGVLALEHQDLDRAVEWLRQATIQLPHDRQSHYALLQALTRLGQAEEASKVATQLARIDTDRKRLQTLIDQVAHRPNDANIRCEIGDIFERNAMPEDAIRWFRTALECDVACRRAHEGMARLLEAQGKADQAAPHRAFLAESQSP